jgi:exocyst complex protein 7
MDPALIQNGVMVKTLNKAQRELVKERFKAFNTEIEEMHKQQKMWAIPDPDLRASMMKEIKSVLIVLYTRFYERFDLSGFNGVVDIKR